MIAGTTTSWSKFQGDENHPVVVTALLAADSIDVNAADENGSTALHEAAMEGHTECVKLLLEVEALDLYKWCSGGTWIHWR